MSDSDLEPEVIDGPPLDVLTPLAHERGHARKSAAAWLIALLLTVVVLLSYGDVVGWERLEYQVSGEVALMHEDEDEDEVSLTFVGRHDGRVLIWGWVVEDDHDWEAGETRTFAVGGDRIYMDRVAGIAGIKLWILLGFFALFGGYAIRRWIGLEIAWRDAHRGSDRPRLGYAALCEDNMPRTWRPLLALWSELPTDGVHLRSPDVIYRADDETGKHLKSSLAGLRVMRAWIDTGGSPWSKPRWVGVEEGVLIPHRTAWFGSIWFNRAKVRSGESGPVEPLHHRAPEPGFSAVLPDPIGRSHRFAPMLAWRVAGMVAFALLSTFIDRGHTFRTVPAPRSVDASAWDRLEATAVPTQHEPHEDIAELLEHHDLQSNQTLLFDSGAGPALLTRWRFPTEEDARWAGDAEWAGWIMSGEGDEKPPIEARLRSGDYGTVEVFVTGAEVFTLLVEGRLSDSTFARIVEGLGD